MSIKIQINSLEALERLIGGDSEIEIQIRNSIVHEFTNKHLKSLATTKIMMDTEQAIKNDIEKQFFDVVENGWKTELHIKDKILKNIEDELHIEGNKILRQIVSEQIAKNSNIDKINDLLNIAAEKISNDLSDIVLQKRIDDLVNAKIKEKLGL